MNDLPMSSVEQIATKIEEVAELLSPQTDHPKRDRADILRDVMAEAGRELMEHAAALRQQEQLAEPLREQPEARGVVDFEAWLDRDWPLWRNNPDNPIIARLRRAWDAALTAAQQPGQEGGGEVAMYQVSPKGKEHWREVSKRQFDAEGEFPGYPSTEWDRRILYTAPPSAPVEVEGLPTDALIDSLETKDALRALCKVLRDALTQQPAQAAPGDDVVGFRAAFFVSRDGNRIEQLTTYEDYRLDGALLALMDAGQKRASAKGLTKKGGGKVVLAWVTALDPTPPGDDAAGGGS